MVIKLVEPKLSSVGKVKFYIPAIGKAYFDYSENFVLTNKDISVMLGEHTEKAAFWRYALVQIRKRLRKAQRELDEQEASVYLFHRNRFLKTLAAGDNRGGPTERYLQNCVTLNKGVEEAREEVEKLQEHVELLEGIREGFSDRRTALMSLGADLRGHNKPTHIRN